MEMTSAIILASGYGQINGRPKVCEKLGRIPIILRIVRNVFLLRDLINEVIVTVNPLFESRVREILNDFPLTYVIQPNRYGSADAVARALSQVHNDSVLIIFGDMPLWKPKTFENVIKNHKHKKVTITLVIIELNERTPKLIERYGRILKNEKGEIIAIIESSEVNGDLCLQTRTVNPSLYCFDVYWLRENINNVPAKAKNDSYPEEKSLPYLVVLAEKQSKKIIEITLEDPFEAIGINTEEELIFAEKILFDLGLT